MAVEPRTTFINTNPERKIFSAARRLYLRLTFAAKQKRLIPFVSIQSAQGNAIVSVEPLKATHRFIRMGVGNGRGPRMDGRDAISETRCSRFRVQFLRCAVCIREYVISARHSNVEMHYTKPNVMKRAENERSERMRGMRTNTFARNDQMPSHTHYECANGNYVNIK